MSDTPALDTFFKEAAEGKTPPPYTQVLTPAERAACMKVGFVAAAAAQGVSPTTVENWAKTAADGPGFIDAGLKLALLGSLVTGLPLGLLAHSIGKRTGERNLAQQEAQQKIDFYREASQGLEHGLASRGATL